MENGINLSAYPAPDNGNMESAKAAVESSMKEVKELRDAILPIIVEYDGGTQFGVKKLLNGLDFNLTAIQIAVTDVPSDVCDSDEYADMCAKF